MREQKMLILIAAVSVVLATGPVWAQTPPAQGAPAGQTPPAQTPPAAQQPAAQAQPPKPFPEGAKIAYVNINVIAGNSVEGKAASAKIQDFVKKRQAEIQEKQKTLQSQQAKLQQGVSVMSDQARGQLEKEITKLSRELQIAQEDSQTETQQLTQELQAEFQQKLYPVIDALANERGLHMVFSSADAGAIWWHTGLDLSAEVIKRFDAASKPGTTKK